MSITKSEKRQIAARANFCCEYCQCMSKFVPVPFVIEHIIPKVKGGTDTLDNLAFACHHCNGSKHAKTKAVDPLTDRIVELFHPRLNKWSTHFQWNDDFTKVIGLTPKGRATIKTLKLNREHVINHRNVLFLYGVHPPQHTLSNLE